MLQKPGSTSSSSSSSTPRTVRSKQNQPPESPDDIIRKLSRISCNKKCCDCTSKLPNIVNVTLGIFLCPICAGIHRELPNSLQRIKSIGHTTFTMDEIQYIQQYGGNDIVNAIYLANYHPSQERIKPPTDNSDIHILRNWILRKYKDKTWYRNPNDNNNNSGNNNSTTSNNTAASMSQSTTNNSNSSSSSSNSKPGRGIAGMMRQPTVVSNIPPKQKKSIPTNENDIVIDLFDMTGPTTTTTSTTTTTTADSEWDAFSNSRVQQQPPVDDFADFDTIAPTSTTTTSFANFDTIPSSQQPQPPTNNNAAAAAAVTNMNNIIISNNNNMMTDQFANFSSTVPPPPPQQQPVTTTVATGTNFGHFPPTTSTTTVTTMTHSKDGFANFDHQIASTTSSMSQLTINNNNMNSNSFPPPTVQQQPMPMISQVSVPSQEQQLEQQPPPATFDKFDAFDSIQISSNVATTSAVTNVDNQLSMLSNVASTNTMTSPPTISNTKNMLKSTKFHSGQKVYYKSSSYSGPAEIIKVHLDDALEPFYTIILTNENGKEKQTDDAHLSECPTGPAIDHMNRSSNNDTTTASSTASLQEEITNMLTNLSLEQLQQLKQYIVAQHNNNGPIRMTLPTTVPTLNNAAPDISLTSTPLEMTTTTKEPLPPQSQSIAPGQLTMENFSLSKPPPPPSSSSSSQLPIIDTQSLSQNQVLPPVVQYPVVDGVAHPLNQNVPPQQDHSGSFPMNSMSAATGMTMTSVGPTTTTTTMMNNDPSGVTTNSSSTDAFGGIPSPDVGDESKPVVASLNSLPPPPLVQQQMQAQYNPSMTMMNSTTAGQGYMAYQMSQQPSSMTMNPMPDPTMMMQYNPNQQFSSQQNPSMPQMNGIVPQQQQQQPPMTSNEQVTQSPLSPKGNPFDFY